MLHWIGSRISRETVAFAAVWYILLGIGLTATAFFTAKDRVTPFGTPLMPDFAAMYLAGEMLNEHGPDRLYDFPLQEKVRRAQFPRTEASERLPYVYAPWFALLWKPFSSLSYEGAAASWLVVSLGLMAGGFACLWQACPQVAGSDRRFALLVAMSFEPFVFECWANGQVSSFPFLLICAALMLQKQDRPVAAGVVLALLTYKPMQPPLLFALLLVGARWRTLGGVVLGGLGLAAVSMAAFGPGILVEYPQRLLEYGRLVSPEGGAQLRLPKYTDLQTAARLLGPPLETPMRILAVPVALYFVASLIGLWRRSQERWSAASRHAWASTLVLLPVLNFYFAVYDAILIIPGVMLAATLRMDTDRDAATATPEESPGSRLPRDFLGALALVYLAGCAVPAFEAIRVNLMTLALLVLGWHVLHAVPAEKP